MPRGRKPIAVGIIKIYGKSKYIKRENGWERIGKADSTKTKNKIRKRKTKENKEFIITPKKTERKVQLLTEKIGKSQNALAIIQRNNKFYLSQRIEVKGKKDKFKSLYSNSNLEFIKSIADKLSENLKLAYNPNPIEKEKRKKSDNLEIDTSIFKEYNEHCFIQLGFGTIWLEKNNKFHTKRNYEIKYKQNKN